MSRFDSLRQHGNSFKKKVAESIDMPADLFFDEILIKISGNREVILENYKGILNYNDKTVQVSAKPHNVKITGTGLEIKVITDEILYIAGEISGISFVEE